jgi:hypothetical protein
MRHINVSQLVCTSNFFLSVMDIKKLIEQVENYPEIWNPHHVYYHHRPKLTEIWNEIALATGFPSKIISFVSSFEEKYFLSYFLFLVT